MANTVRVKGLRELQRDFKRMSKDLAKDLRKELKEVAEPVRSGSERLALGNIRNLPRSPSWAAMKTGMTAKSVYVRPAKRGGGGRARPNFGAMLLDRAMDPSLEENQGKIVDGLDKMLGRLGGDYGF